MTEATKWTLRFVKVEKWDGHPDSAQHKKEKEEASLATADAVTGAREVSENKIERRSGKVVESTARTGPKHVGECCGIVLVGGQCRRAQKAVHAVIVFGSTAVRVVPVCTAAVKLLLARRWRGEAAIVGHRAEWVTELKGGGGVGEGQKTINR